MNSFLVELILLWFVLLAGVPALLAVIWRSLKRQGRSRAARSMCRWVSALWVIAIIVILLVLSAVAKQGSWNAMSWWALIPFGIAVLPTLIMTLLLSTNKRYPELRE